MELRLAALQALQIAQPAQKAAAALALHSAADAAPPNGLQHLAHTDPAQLRLRVRAGTAVLASAHPIVAIWQAHQPTAAEQYEQDERYAAVRAAFAQGRGEAALVWREGWRVRVAALPPADVAFTAAVQQGRTLAQALDAAGADFDFSPWLVSALQRGWLAAAEPTPP